MRGRMLTWRQNANMHDQVSKVRPTLVKLFDQMDTARAGFLNRRQIVQGLKTLKLKIPPEVKEVFAPGKVKSLFEFMEVDKDVGVLSLDDLVEGLSRFGQEGIPIETKQIMGLLRGQKRSMKEVTDKLTTMQREVVALGYFNGLTEEDKAEAMHAVDVIDILRDETSDPDMTA